MTFHDFPVFPEAWPPCRILTISKIRIISSVWRTPGSGGLQGLEDSRVWRTLESGGVRRLEDSRVWRICLPADHALTALASWSLLHWRHESVNCANSTPHRLHGWEPERRGAEQCRAVVTVVLKPAFGSELRVQLGILSRRSWVQIPS